MVASPKYNPEMVTKKYKKQQCHSTKKDKIRVPSGKVVTVVPDYLTGVDLNSREATRSFNPLFLWRVRKFFGNNAWTVPYAISLGLANGIQVYNPFQIRVHLEGSPFNQYSISHDGTSRGWYAKLKSDIQNLNNLENDIDIVTESGLLLDQYPLEDLYSRRNYLQSIVKILDAPRIYENTKPKSIGMTTSSPIAVIESDNKVPPQNSTLGSYSRKTGNHSLDEITKNFVNDIVDGIESQIKNGARFKDILKDHSNLVALVLQAFQRDSTREFARDAGMTNENLSSLVPYVKDKLSSLANKHNTNSLIGCNVCGGQVQTMVRPDGGYDKLYQNSELPMQTGCPYCGGSDKTNPQEDYQLQGSEFQGSHLFSSHNQQLIGAPHGGSVKGGISIGSGRANFRGGNRKHRNKGHGHRGHGGFGGSIILGGGYGGYGGYYGPGGVWYDGPSDYYDNDNYDDDDYGSDSDGYESDSFISTQVPSTSSLPNKLIGAPYDDKNITEFVRSQMIGSGFFDGFMASSSGLLKSLKKSMLSSGKDSSDSSDSDNDDYDSYQKKHHASKHKKTKWDNKGKNGKKPNSKQYEKVRKTRNDFLVTPETQDPSFAPYSEEFTSPQFDGNTGEDYNQRYPGMRDSSNSTTTRYLKGPDGNLIVDDNTFKNPEKYLALSLESNSGLYESDNEGTGDDEDGGMNDFYVKEIKKSRGPEIKWLYPQSLKQQEGYSGDESARIPETSNFMNLLKANKPLMARLTADGNRWILFVPSNRAFTSKRASLIGSHDESKVDKYLSKYLCRDNFGTDPDKLSGAKYVSTSGDHVFQMAEPLGDTSGYKHLVANRKHSKPSFPIEAYGKLNVNSSGDDYTGNNVYVFVHSAPLEKLPRNV